MKKFSFDKTIQQISVVSKEAFDYGGQVYEPPDFVKVSPTFWRKYGCYLGCGGCCYSFSLDYTPDEARLLPLSLRMQTTVQSISINGQKKVIHSIPPRSSDKWCQFLDRDSGGCSIHEYNPFSCKIELIKVRRIKNKGYISKQPYGRAWAMKTIADEPVLCDFAEFDERQFWTNDLPVLDQLRRWSDYLGIRNNVQTIKEALVSCVENRRLRTFKIFNV